MIRPIIMVGAAAGLVFSAVVAYAFVCGWPIPLIDQDFGSDFN